MEYWKKWSTQSMDMCRLDKNKNSNKEKVKPIKLVELSSAFLVLGIGLTLSILAYFLEWLIGSFIFKRFSNTVIVLWILSILTREDGRLNELNYIPTKFFSRFKSSIIEVVVPALIVAQLKFFSKKSQTGNCSLNLS